MKLCISELIWVAVRSPLGLALAMLSMFYKKQWIKDWLLEFKPVHSQHYVQDTSFLFKLPEH